MVRGTWEEFGGWECVVDVLLDQFDTQIGIVARLDFMADTRDEFVLFAHRVDELARGKALIVGLGEFNGCTIKGTTETLANGK